MIKYLTLFDHCICQLHTAIIMLLSLLVCYNDLNLSANGCRDVGGNESESDAERARETRT